MSGSRLSALLIIPLVLIATAAHAQSLRGSRASVDLMYRQALNHDLHFYETTAGVRRAHQRGDFVKLAGNADYLLANVSHPYVLPSTEVFIERLAAQYRSACGEKLVVTSGIRPRSIRLVNSVDKTVHPTGMAVDLRKPAKRRCLSWLRETLSYLDGTGVVEATEEHRPPHFHVAVFPTQYTKYVRGNGGAAEGVKLAASTDGAAVAAAESAGEARTYRVRRGDSLWTIARRNKVSVAVLKEANDLRSSRIVAGQVLKIPTR